MKLLINYETFTNSENGQVYPLELPNFFAISGGMSIEQYYQKVMINTQIIIDNYCQSILSKADYDLDNFSNVTKEYIIQILIAEFIYLHENQIFFKKTNEIQYSTAGQQTFTFSPEMDKNTNYFIPQNVKKMIENAGILNYSSSILNSGFNVAQGSNEFLDGIFVTDVRWDSKANSTFILNGANLDVIDFLIFLNSDYISKKNPDWIQMQTVSQLFVIQNNKISSNLIFSAPNIFPNKSLSDYAQVDDIIKTYDVINENVQNNTNDITNLTSIAEQLQTSKVSYDQLTINLSTKADTNLLNVNVGAYPNARSVIVDTNGNIQFSSSGGAIFDITQWNDTISYSSGRMVFVFGETPSKIYISTTKLPNKNKNPITEPTYWQITNLNIDLTNYYTKNEVNQYFLNKVGSSAILSTNLDLSGFAINNASNILDDSTINDSIISDTNLWTSQKTNFEIQNLATSLKEYEIFKVWEVKHHLARSANFTYDNHFVALDFFKNFSYWEDLYAELKMTSEEISIFESSNEFPLGKDIFPLDRGTPSLFWRFFRNAGQPKNQNSIGFGISNNYNDFNCEPFNSSEEGDYISESNLPVKKMFLNNTYASAVGQIQFHRGAGGSWTGKYPVVSGFYDSNPTRTDTQYFVELNSTMNQKSFQSKRVILGMKICYRALKVKTG